MLQTFTSANKWCKHIEVQKNQKKRKEKCERSKMSGKHKAISKSRHEKWLKWFLQNS
jgi:hypothetical protein